MENQNPKHIEDKVPSFNKLRDLLVSAAIREFKENSPLKKEEVTQLIRLVKELYRLKVFKIKPTVEGLNRLRKLKGKKLLKLETYQAAAGKSYLFDRDFYFEEEITDQEWADLANIIVPELQERLKKGQQALKLLRKYHLKLITSIAKIYEHKYFSMDELIEIGSMGINFAAISFKENQEYTFSTFSVFYIRNEITNQIHARELCLADD